ncbi:hypothetical protein B0H16DRAFT_1496469 [Mycena metata]|uniref:FAD-binding domain-containing protein n=1 Tax=Mycena metata TaxID=1033252 RepID=A0AAD7KB36_9AGAR|nr:hypothetical protein B0H16DRAFT_1496469 [Mycena metata]
MYNKAVVTRQAGSRGSAVSHQQALSCIRGRSLVQSPKNLPCLTCFLIQPMSQEVAIIGAGLSGLSLALALHQQSIPFTIYESRPDAPLNIDGAVMLSPNALRILDHLGVYDIMRTRGYNFTKLEYRDVASTSGPEDMGVVEKHLGPR